MPRRFARLDRTAGVRPHGTPPEPAPALRVLTANLRYDNPHSAGLATLLRRERPDVVVLTECTGVSAAELLADGVLTDYRWRLDDGRSGGDIVVFSRPPLRPGEPILAGDRRFPQAVLTLPDGELPLLAVHAVGPSNPVAVRDWAAQLAAVRRAVCRGTGALLVVGDFNATNAMLRAAGLLGNGVVDAAGTASHGRSATFPAGPPWTLRLPLLQLDHVLTRAPLYPRGASTGPRYGSDHLPVLADLDWAPGVLVSRSARAQRPRGRPEASPAG